MNAPTRLLAVPLVLAAAWLAGCSRTPADPNAGPSRADELNEVAGMLRDFSAAFNRGPSRAADLIQYENAYPFGGRALRSGDIVVVSGATVAGEGEAATAAAAVIAYEKKTPSEGGYVLLQNGTVKEMTAEEFKAAPQAGK
jgi:hypothetical protein